MFHNQPIRKALYLHHTSRYQDYILEIKRQELLAHELSFIKLFNLANSFFMERKFDEAKTYFSLLFKKPLESFNSERILHKKDPNYLANLLKMIEEIKEKEPKVSPTYLWLKGGLLLMQKNYLEALNTFNYLFEHLDDGKKNYSSIAITVFTLNLRLKNYESARKTMEEFSLNPSLLNKTYLFYHLGDLEEAKRYFLLFLESYKGEKFDLLKDTKDVLEKLFLECQDVPEKTQRNYQLFLQVNSQ